MIDGRPPQSYQDVRAARKAAKAARKAAKPKGIDLPFRKSMPPWLLAAFAAVTAVTLVVVAIVLVNPPAPRIALAERRSPPSGSLSHDVGAITLAPVPDQLPPTRVRCPAVSGVTIEGGEPAHVRLGGVLERMCPHATGDSEFANAFRALSNVRIRFARFARSGDASTLSVADPVRVLINVQFARRDVSALWIAPLLAHEGFHLLHRERPWTAELELGARQAELQACRLLIDVRGWPRGCTDARRLVEFGRERAVEQLVRAGFPRS